MPYNAFINIPCIPPFPHLLLFQAFVLRVVEHPLNYRRAPTIIISSHIQPSDKAYFGHNRPEQTGEVSDDESNLFVVFLSLASLADLLDEPPPILPYLTSPQYLFPSATSYPFRRKLTGSVPLPGAFPFFPAMPSSPSRSHPGWK